MIRRKTVFVVGAGASFELGLPLGETLLEKIAASLSFKSDYGSVSGGSCEIWRAISQECQDQNLSLQEHLEASWRVRDAAYLGLSIDNVVHQQYSDDAVVRIAKLAISYNLLKSEDECALKSHSSPNMVTWPKVRGTWLGRLAQLLVQDVHKSKLDNIFENTKIISFNYDRTIRRFLPIILRTQFAISGDDAIALSKLLPIYHPYGSLGPLEWEGGSKSVSFGCPDSANLSLVANNIKTFTERLESGSPLESMRAAVSEAECIVFLGFGYLPQNMQIILEGVAGSARTVMGTSYGLSEPDEQIVSAQMNTLFQPAFRAHKIPYLKPLKCEEFLRMNFRTIAS